MYYTEHSKLCIEGQHGRQTVGAPLPARLFHKQQKRHWGALKSPLPSSWQARLTQEATPQTLLLLSLLLEARVLFPSPGQLTIPKPRDPSSFKCQLHQMAQLKGLVTSASVTSDAHKTGGRERRGTAKNIALGRTKEKKCWEKRDWMLV